MFDNSALTSRSQTMTIGEVSKLTGLSASAIRFYQRRGLLPERDASGGWQRFDSETLGRLALIELAKSAGFSLDEIIRLFDALAADPDSIPEQTPIWCGLAEAKLSDIAIRIQRLDYMRRFLQDALNSSYVAPDRIREVPPAMGWTLASAEEAAALPHPVEVPPSLKGLDTTTKH